ncbi:MAG: hypothetical protein EZS28_011938 [Streblomastix strix]|uniref:Uncharacterized protein n=1 Tax=Streblomastix strix TaxID=222440 RepID=A0A5J4WDL9_9EUKA|nr:MAG: hypothetical protein EZS28_011938 [Streblomastix strix]
MTTIQTNQLRVHKSKQAIVAKKLLSKEDKMRLQAIDGAITNGFRKQIQFPCLQVSWNQPQPIFSHELSSSSVQTPLQSRNLVIYEQEEEQGILIAVGINERSAVTERPRR